MKTPVTVSVPFGRRLAVTVIVAAGCLLLAALAMPEQIRSRLARQERLDPPCAPAAESTRCLVWRANVQRKKAEFADAVALSRAALAREPLHLAALETLVRSINPSRVEERRRLYGLIGKLSKHSFYAHSQLMMEAYGGERPDVMMYHADVLLRWGQVTADQVYEAVMAYATDETGRAAITRRLATDPPWRADFLRTVSSKASAADALALAATMNRLGAGQTPIEAEFLVSRLLQEDRYAELRQLRRTLLPRGRAEAFVYDGAFEGLEGPASFIWQTLKLSGGEAVLGTVETNHPGTLLLRHDLFSSSDWMVRQQILLPPGRYRLTLAAEGLNDQGNKAFVIEVACRGASSVVRIPIQTGATGWVSSKGEFTIPDESCQAQWLAFAPVTGDRVTSAEILVDRVSITRSTTPAPPPPQPARPVDEQ